LDAFGDQNMLPPDIKSKLTQAQPVCYEIRVHGQLDPCWSEEFAGFTMYQTESGETIISGLILDQAALNGLLNRLLGMNLILISVYRIESGLSPGCKKTDRGE
jgi:hypothetical protein